MESAALKRNLSRFELALVVIVIAVLMAVVVERMLGVSVQAERMAFELTLRNIRTGLTAYSAEQIMAGRQADMGKLAGTNPIGVVVNAPRNYAGVLGADEPEKVAPGSWYFDARDGFLIYRVASPDAFFTRLPGPKRARFRVLVSFRDTNGDGRFEPGTDTPTGLILKPVEPYAWTVH